VAVASGKLLVSIITFLLYASVSGKLFGYGVLPQLKDAIPIIITNIFVGGVVYAVSFINLSPLMYILFSGLLAVTVYIVMSRLLKIQEFFEIQLLIKKFLGKKLKVKQNF